MAQGQSNGITGVVEANLPTWMTMVAFSTIALYNVIELNVIIFATFKRRQGLYFWSFIVATWGIAPHVVGFILVFFRIIPLWWPTFIPVSIGWFFMVTGQSLVLYSRLHLVAGCASKIRWVLYMILFNATIIGIPDLTLAALANRPHAHVSFVNAFTIFDKVQVGIFFVQESIISGFYIYKTVQLLGPVKGRDSHPLRKLLSHLILVNALVLILDATLLGTEYSGNWEIQTMYKPAIYSIKLKIEFSVLNRLVDLVKNKGLAGGILNHSSNSNSLRFLTSPPANIVEGTVMGDKQPTLTTTELSTENTNRGEHPFGRLKTGKTMYVENSTTILRS